MVDIKDVDKFAINMPPRISCDDDYKSMLINLRKNNGADLYIMGSNFAFMKINKGKFRCTNRKLSDKEVEYILSRIYGDEALAVLSSKKPLKFSYEFKAEIDGSTETLRFRMNAITCFRNSRRSITINARLISSEPVHPDKFYIEPEIKDLFREADQGLILVTGETGSGKTTLLSTMIRMILEKPNSGKNLVTIEDPIEYIYEKICDETSFSTQLEVGSHIESFSDGLESILRMNADIVLVGETKTYKEFKFLFEIAASGNVCYSTLHSNNASETIQRILSSCPADELGEFTSNFISNIKGIISQRLIETTTGGITPIREILTFNAAMKDELFDSKNIKKTIDKQLALHGKPMMIDIQNLYDNGTISDTEYKIQRLSFER